MSGVDVPSAADNASSVHALRSLIREPWGTGDGGHVDAIAASNLSVPTKLATLTHLKSVTNDPDELMPVALSVVRTDLDLEQREEKARLLIDRVSDEHGVDPLGRANLSDNSKHDDLLPFLNESVTSNTFSVMASCEADRINVNGKPVLFVETELWTTSELHALEPVIDPLKWPDCPVQSEFFKSMQPQGALVDLPSPDQGWRATIRETVDFGFGGGEMVTDLDMVFSVGPKAIGCTYALNKSVDGRIQHDEGYLLAQDFEATMGARRITTLKAVWFTEENTPTEQVCPVWSLSAGLVAHACLQE